MVTCHFVAGTSTMFIIDIHVTLGNECNFLYKRLHFAHLIDNITQNTVWLGKLGCNVSYHASHTDIQRYILSAVLYSTSTS